MLENQNSESIATTTSTLESNEKNDVGLDSITNNNLENIEITTNIFNLSRRIDLFFTGKGSDYFKIWITNLTLTIITFGLYYPWAKARRQRYFWAHTVVDGHSLGFHGKASSMFKGYAIASVLAIIYYALSQFAPIYQIVMFAFLALIYPILFRASLRFLLLNTSWRGLRFRFLGSVKQSYGYLAPIMLVSFLLIATPLMVVYFTGVDFNTVLDRTDAKYWWALGILLVTTFLIILIGVPLAYFKIKKYQKDFYSYASLKTQFNGTGWQFYKILIKTVGVSMITGMALGIIFAIVGGLSIFIFSTFSTSVLFKFISGFAVTAIIVANYLLMGVIVNSYFTSRHFNFFWGKLTANGLKINANLQLKKLIFLNVKNYILTILTLGLYYPFAKIASTKLQVESLHFESTINFDELISNSTTDQQGNFGEAMSDLFDFDFGF